MADDTEYQTRLEEAEVQWRDKYNQADRDRMAKSGEAMPDGAYPIADADDLHNAIHTVGLGSAGHGAIKAHIIKRAKALKLTAQLPESWGVETKEATVPAVAKRQFNLREYEVPHLAYMEVRSAEVGDSVSVGLRGYPSTCGDGYDVSDWLGEYRETIAHSAFGKTLSESKYIPLLLDHRGDVMAAYHTEQNHTMDLAEDGRGLLMDASLDTVENATSRTVASGVRRGDLSKMSFAFQGVKDTWNADFTERTVEEARVFDVSVVKSPANAMTSVGLRADMIDWLGREGVATLVSTREAFDDLIQEQSFEAFEPWAEKSILVFRSIDEYLTRAYPYAGRARTIRLMDIMTEVRSGKQISSANEHMLRSSLEALSQADNALKQVAGASAEAQMAINTVLGDTVAMQGGEKVANDGGLDTGKLNDGNPVLPNDGGGPRSNIKIPESVRKAQRELELMRLRNQKGRK